MVVLEMYAGGPVTSDGQRHQEIFVQLTLMYLYPKHIHPPCTHYGARSHGNLRKELPNTETGNTVHWHEGSFTENAIHPFTPLCGRYDDC